MGIPLPRGEKTYSAIRLRGRADRWTRRARPSGPAPENRTRTGLGGASHLEPPKIGAGSLGAKCRFWGVPSSFFERTIRRKVLQYIVFILTERNAKTTPEEMQRMGKSPGSLYRPAK